MKNRFWIGWTLLLVISGLMFIGCCCAKKTVMSEPAVTPAAEEDAEAKRLKAQEARARALEEQRLREQRAEAAARQKFENQDIHFEFDKSTLSPEAQAILRDKAKYLAAHPDVSAIIEGHCDERGTNEYNMALGDRRAGSAKSFLVDLGVASRHLTAISYGEEKPVDPGSNEAAWAKNRRAHFVLE